MGSSAQKLVGDVDLEKLIERLSRLHDSNITVAYWTHAVGNRLGGNALVLLAEELQAVGEQSLKGARRLADRIGQLGGEVTASPADLLESSLFSRYAIPDETSAVYPILEYALTQVRTLLDAYSEVIEMVRGRDDLTYRLITELTEHAVRQEDDLEAALS